VTTGTELRFSIEASVFSGETRAPTTHAAKNARITDDEVFLFVTSEKFSGWCIVILYIYL
jgi:hypothetical protein